MGLWGTLAYSPLGLHLCPESTLRGPLISLVFYPMYYHLSYLCPLLYTRGGGEPRNAGFSFFRQLHLPSAVKTFFVECNHSFFFQLRFGFLKRFFLKVGPFGAIPDRAS